MTRLGYLAVLVGLASPGPACDRPAPKLDAGIASPPTAAAVPPPSSSAASHKAKAAAPPAEACTAAHELTALTSTAADPERERAELGRPLLSHQQARHYAASVAPVALAAIAEADFETLATLVDDAGLCLRPSKGAPCHQLTRAELRTCGKSRTKSGWNVDDGSDEEPELTCAQAFRDIFFERDFRQVRARFNCFPHVGRGNNAYTIIQPPTRAAYVEYFAEEQSVPTGFPLPWRALWLVFDGPKPKLVELIAEYQGP